MNKKENQDVNYFAETNFRDNRRIFGIKKLDRRHHMYLIGQTGTGKTTLLETMIEQDMAHGEGLAVLDPHGDVVEKLVTRVPEHRLKDLIYFNVPDPNCPYGFNPLASVPPQRRPLAAEEVLEAFKKMWSTTWGPRLEHILRHSLLTLFEQPTATFADLDRLFTDEIYRRQAVARVSNPQVRAYWTHQFARYSERFKEESLSPIRNKVGAFLADPVIHRVIANAPQNIDLRQAMDTGKILLVNISKGRIGGPNSSLLGALMVSRFQMAALSRAEMPERDRRDFFLYLDEFQNFTTMSMAEMLSELRKYHLNLIMAHQYLSQIDEEVRDAILGNVGTKIAFRVGPADAKILAQQFSPKFNEHDLINLDNFQIYLKLMIDGKVSRAFSAETLSPSEK